MKNLKDILTWKKSFGLLPIHLMSTLMSKDIFIMLNGGYGDFCLKTEPEEEDYKLSEYYSYSWSSNTKNFVTVDGSNINIYNWNQEQPETIPQKQVDDNFDKFYGYLVSNSNKSEKDVVPFVIDIFKKFRNLTQEKENAVEALNLLFLLLAGLEEDINSIDFNKWGLTKINIPNNFDVYTEILKNGISDIKPKLDLIIRHSSGILFQEAQKEALFFDGQIDLWGAFSSKIKSEKKHYSSIHYTPPYLARTIVENAIRQVDISKPELKIFDPACGSSEFLIEVLKQLSEKQYLGKITIIGWDSSQTAINISNFLLHYEKRTIWKERLDFSVKFVEDSLLGNWSNDYDLILMNPPFVSWEQMLIKSRDAVKSVLSANIVGRPNQASAFFFKAIQSLNSTGVIGSVIPTSLLTLDAYLKLRKDIYDLISITIIGKLGNFIFEDALTDVSFIIGQKSRKEDSPYVLWTKNEKGIAQNALRNLRKMYYSNSFKIEEKDFSIYKPDHYPTKDNWKPISSKENDLLKNLERFVYERKLDRVQDVFNVQQGIRTGNNNIFKITEAAYTKLPLKEKGFFRPAIDNESVKNGQILIINYIWYPYDKDGLTIKSEKNLAAVAPDFYNMKLKPNKRILENRAGITEWWSLTRPRNWQFSNKEKFVSTEFGKSDSFAFDKSGKFAVERGNSWLPKKEFKNIDYYYFYLALLSSPFFDKLLSIYSKQLLSGWDLGKKYTKDIPIPNVNMEAIRQSLAYSQLVKIGKELSEGNYNLKTIVDDILLKNFYPEV